MQLAERRPSMESNEAQYLFTESELNELIADERAAEREACAQICALRAKDFQELLEKFGHEHDDGARSGASQCEQLIRARGQQ
jgi:hypothetical protein